MLIGPSRVAIVIGLLLLAVLAPPVTTASDTSTLNPVADTWANSAKPGRNYGGHAMLRVQNGVAEAYLRFRLTPWLGRNAAQLELRVAAIEGDPAGLSVTEVAGGWSESGLTWRSRPQALSAESVPASIVGGEAVFALASFFPDGVIDQDKLSLRVTNSAAASVRFSSREGSVAPVLALMEIPQAQAGDVAADADSYVSSVLTTTNYGVARWLTVDAGPDREAYLSFDVSPWMGQPVENVTLRVRFKDVAGKGIGVHRITSTWQEGLVTWANRPAAGMLVATVGTKTPAGQVAIDVTQAFSTGTVDVARLALRLTTTNTNGFLMSSREGPQSPVLEVTPGSGTVPPTPTPTPSPTPTPTPSPTPTPTLTPTPPPGDPSSEWRFRGQGTDHGVGMSQYGARGRANAGQTYDQILAHYYTDTTLGSIPAHQVVRVQLTSAYMPTPTLPARVVARGGTWFSGVLQDVEGQPIVFPTDSYAEMATDGTAWTVSVHDSAGTMLASAPIDDLLMEGTSAGTLFEMKFRDSLRKYELYRGNMRMVAGASGIQTINVVSMNDYLKGVVPAEIPPLWAAEAVKVQAVAARSYAYRRLKPANAFDVVPTADNQVYGGVLLEHTKSNRAVDETAGQVVLFNGAVANTYFFTIAGGHTEHNEFAWVTAKGKVISDPIAYLRGVPDVDENGVAYDSTYGKFAWQSDSFTRAELEEMLNNDSRTRVGTLLDIQFERGVSSRVYRVTLTGTNGTFFVSGQVLKGIYNNNRLSGSGLKSSMYWLEPAL